MKQLSDEKPPEGVSIEVSNGFGCEPRIVLAEENDEVSFHVKKAGSVNSTEIILRLPALYDLLLGAESKKKFE